MDVTCSRCRSEYEFDDALISQKGTTVRCTACGLQFKVYAGKRATEDELWRVYDPENPQDTELAFESLGRLQQAIVHGDVNSRYVLVRGARAPRSLAQIAELQPLLRQRTSERPDASEESETVASVPLGIADGKLPSFSAPLSSVPDTLVEPQRFDDVIVPSNPPEPIDSDGVGSWSSAPSSVRGGPRPRIRSVLSTPPGSSPSEGSNAEPMSERSAVLAPRASLRQTFSAARDTPRDAHSEAPSEESPGAETAPDQLPPPALPEEVAPGLSSMALPEHQPRITEVDSFPAQMTPTPSSLLAYGRVDSSQVSSLPGAPASRRARSGGIVVSVLVGAVLFLGFANRKRIIELLDTRGESSKEAIPFEVDPALTKKLQAAEADWIRWRLLNKEKNSHKTELARAALLEELRQQNREKSWDAVNLLRAQGKVSEARELAGQLAEGASGALSLTLLDLAESIEAGETPPWPLVLERLKEASSGERGRFFARTVYIYSLFESGQAAKATADFEAFSRLSGAQKSPLFEDLRAYLTANSDDGPKTAEKPEGKRGSPGPGPKAKGKSELPEGSVPSVSASTPEPKGAHLGTSAPEDGSESTPRESTEPGELDEPAPPLVPPATTVKAQRADELWRTGNREKALILYREIVRELGTTGHLGQRAAARIRLAEQAGKETP